MQTINTITLIYAWIGCIAVGAAALLLSYTAFGWALEKALKAGSPRGMWTAIVVWIGLRITRQNKRDICSIGLYYELSKVRKKQPEVWASTLRMMTEKDEELCEGCQEPATTHDSEGVPLCPVCAALKN